MVYRVRSPFPLVVSSMMHVTSSSAARSPDTVQLSLDPALPDVSPRVPSPIERKASSSFLRLLRHLQISRPSSPSLAPFWLIVPAFASASPLLDLRAACAPGSKRSAHRPTCCESADLPLSSSSLSSSFQNALAQLRDAQPPSCRRSLMDAPCHVRYLTRLDRTTVCSVKGSAVKFAPSPFCGGTCCHLSRHLDLSMPAHPVEQMRTALCRLSSYLRYAHVACFPNRPTQLYLILATVPMQGDRSTKCAGITPCVYRTAVR